jgi:hypothetical protein
MNTHTLPNQPSVARIGRGGQKWTILNCAHLAKPPKKSGAASPHFTRQSSVTCCQAEKSALITLSEFLMSRRGGNETSIQEAARQKLLLDKVYVTSYTYSIEYKNPRERATVPGDEHPVRKYQMSKTVYSTSQPSATDGVSRCATLADVVSPATRAILLRWPTSGQQHPNWSPAHCKAFEDIVRIYLQRLSKAQAQKPVLLLNPGPTPVALLPARCETSIQEERWEALSARIREPYTDSPIGFEWTKQIVKPSHPNRQTVQAARTPTKRELNAQKAAQL